MIDIEKSIKNLRLIIKNNVLTKVSNLFFRLICFGIALETIFFTITDVADGLHSDNLPLSRITVNFILILISFWFAHGAYFMDKLVKFKGGPKIKNRDLMYEILTEKFKDMRFFFIEDIMMGIKSSKLSSKEVTVIFSGENIYISIINKGISDAYSPIHVLWNQADIKEIRTILLERIEKS